jgi:glutathione peroxidase
MKHFLLITTIMVAAGAIVAAERPTEMSTQMSDALDVTMTSLDGRTVDLNRYRGKVVLMVNVASECGYTYQYEGLQNLHDRYTDRGLKILGFPSNDFGSQEPGSNGEIQDFCERNYGVRFDMFSKIPVTGSAKVELYKFLTSRSSSPFPGEVAWNFEKFLVGRDGKIINRFKSPVEPESRTMIGAIEAALD